MKEEREWGRRLQELITNAVEKALQCEPPGNSINLNNSSNKNNNNNNNGRKRNFCDKESEERRHLAAKIYALLVQWRSDFSFQWRAKVSQSVRVFEEAIADYLEEEATEYYNSTPFLLQSRLLLLLRHFEAGNGPYILRGINPNTFMLPPFDASLSSNSSATAAKRITIASLLALAERTEQTRAEMLPAANFNKPYVLTSAVQCNEYSNGVDYKGKSKLEDLVVLSGLAGSKSPSTSMGFHSTGKELDQQQGESEGSNTSVQGLLCSARVSETSHSGLEYEEGNGDITNPNPNPNHNPNRSRVSLLSLMREGGEGEVLGSGGSTPLASWESWEEPAEKLDPQCCVCMMGLKGAALVPCGHTFCRKCARELWKCRGTCPLCNTLITEILDIY